MDTDPIPPAGPGSDPVTPTPLPHVTPIAPETTPLSVSSPQMTDSGLAPNLAAFIAVLLTPITSLIFLFLEKRNQFVRFWAMQALFFIAAIVVFAIVTGVIGSVLAHIFLPLAWLWNLFCLLIDLGFVAVWIIMLVQAFSGKEWSVPVIGPLARQQLTRPPVA